MLQPFFRQNDPALALWLYIALLPVCRFLRRQGKSVASNGIKVKLQRNAALYQGLCQNQSVSHRNRLVCYGMP